MCGICGIYNFSKDNLVDRAIITRMTDAMVHRGPDEGSIFVKSNIGFGHRRLSIIDLVSGHQPVFNEDGSICVILNGEIYNYKEIRSSLIGLQHVFVTNSDTEVIVHAYEEFGNECINKFRGMFSFAIWDSRKEELFIGRDRIGKKPLYFLNNEKCLIFASEIKCILEAGLYKSVVNRKAIDEFISLGYICAPDTLFENIHKLLPAHYLVCGLNGVRIRKYWFPELLDTTKLGLNFYKEKVVDVLTDSVKYRMISDVPLGAFLSGGLDSSIIVGLMSKLASGSVKTFSIGYSGAYAESELHYAKRVSNFFSTDHNEIILEPVDFADAIHKMTWHIEEPIGDHACIPLWLMSREAKKYVTVLLSGEGSDEIFAGYDIYLIMLILERYRKVPSSIRKVLLDPIVLRLLGRVKGSKYVEWSNLPLEKRFLGDMADTSSLICKQLYNPEFCSEIRDKDFLDKISTYYSQTSNKDPLSRMQYLDQKTWLVDDLLLKADKMTMAASVELRCPFLDHSLVELTQQIPWNLKLHGLEKKFVLKEAFKNFLPKEIIYRKKRGFPVPLSSWFKGDLNSYIVEVLLDRKSVSRGYFNKGFIENLVKNRNSKKEDVTNLLWKLLVLESWHNVFIDRV
ncbi:MAG: asparagine synthase (glutamine-hydrolyzing) [Prolixibacteraceae bacterium]|nr:asparagine synthase (glutamine-hydrolyzing) [Prolixibacteraceae bacterium]